MKKTTLITIVAAALLLGACAPQNNTVQPPAVSVQNTAPTAQSAQPSQPAAPAVQSNGLTQAEVDGLLFMREEEKLAMDVYTFLYQKWGTPIFQNIAESELSHTNAVKTLLNTYGISDPAANTAAGSFADPALQALYDQLTAQGSASLAAALKVGAAIEEIDILDLQEEMELTTNADIERVYENLLWGSYNHLRAFVTNLKNQTGETYAPQYLSAEEYQTILNSSGGGGGYQGGRGLGGPGR
jgi:hypothetical protein